VSGKSGIDSAVERNYCGRTHCCLFQHVRATACEHSASACEHRARLRASTALLRASTARTCVRAPRAPACEHRARLRASTVRACVRARIPDKDAVLFCGRTHFPYGRTHLRKNCHILAAVRTNVLPCARAHLCFLHQQTRRQYVLFLNSFNFNRLLDLC
jgi:hypothetical protein